MKRIAFYGGSFDPVHTGHLTVAKTLLELFALDGFWFAPGFHAPHKRDRKTTAAFCRYAMLTLATRNEPKIKISTVELDAPEKPYTVETLINLNKHYANSATIFFVMGADSWNEIDTWRDWEEMLQTTGFIVVTRPNHPLETAHVTDEIKSRIVDLRERNPNEIVALIKDKKIFFTDAVSLDVSSTEVRTRIASQTVGKWRNLVSAEVADYIEKYRLYS